MRKKRKITKDQSTDVFENIHGAEMATKTRNKHKRMPLPLYNVIVHDSNQIKAEHIAYCIMTLVISTTQDAAIALTKKIHSEGQAVVVTTHKERAELYVEQFENQHPPIGASIEAC